MMQDLYAIQEQLEAEQLELGQARYFDMLKIKGAAEMQVGRRVIAGHVDKMVSAIIDATAKKRGPRAAYATALSQVEPVSAAMLALRTVIQQVGRVRTATGVAANIGQMMVEHLNWLHLHGEKELGKGARFMETRVLKKQGHERHRRAVARHYADAHLPPDSKVEWDKKTMVQVGMLLLELMAAETGLIELPMVYNHGKTVTQVRLTNETAEWLAKQHDRASLLDPLFMPMVVPPVPWTTPTDGGYLTRPQYLVKQHNREYQRDLREQDLSEVYAAVNALQETGYRINRGVLAVMSEAVETNSAVGKLPNQEFEPQTAKPHDIKTNDEARKEWKHAERKRNERNAVKRSKVVSVLRIVKLGEKFKDYPAIYFPHFLDWRGRAYALPVDLQPQGSDFAKGLLQFAEGRPLGEDGFQWLCIHIANLFGVDKVSFVERIAWVVENHDRLLDCAFAPLDNLWWTEADKPWQALAAIFEYAGASMMDDNRDYVSHLPIAVDGSCNGLQNLSAMMLDQDGGVATNLVPSAKPQDIYTQVLDRTLEKLRVSATQYGECWDFAQMLLNVGLNRKIVKRPVMTRPYGSTGYGVRKQLIKEFEDQELMDKLIPMPEDADAEKQKDISRARFDCVVYLSKLVEESINEIVVASKQVMDWLQETARTAAGHNLPLTWVTPVGLKVLQDYRKEERDRQRVWVGGVQKEFHLRQATDEVNKQRQANGMSPNVIHSFDASHMMLTINRAMENGVKDFSMVHDSYATHACNTGLLAACLRDVFIEMYSVDRLDDLHQQFIHQVPPDVAAEFPAPPARGTLDLDQVRESDYFFA